MGGCKVIGSIPEGDYNGHTYTCFARRRALCTGNLCDLSALTLVMKMTMVMTMTTIWGWWGRWWRRWWRWWWWLWHWPVALSVHSWRYTAQMSPRLLSRKLGIALLSAVFRNSFFHHTALPRDLIGSNRHIRMLRETKNYENKRKIIAPTHVSAASARF